MPIKDLEARRAYDRGRSRLKTEDKITVDPVATENARLKLKISTLTAGNTALLKALEAEEQIRLKMMEFDNLMPEPPRWLQQRHKSDTPGVPMTIWSDWHYGETVFKAQTGGVNEFNTKIAAARIEKLVDTTITLANDYMVNPSYPGTVVCLGGDMIGGAIHQELATTNDKETLRCVLEVEELIIAGLLRMADAFGRVFVPCVVGNHGRTTQKPQMKNRAETNHEWLMYRHLAQYFKDDKRFLFQVPAETDAHFKVFGHRFLLTHGDALGVKGGDGIIGALGPIARGTFKVGRSEAQIGRDFDTLIMGHYHTYIPRSEAVHVIVNGALKGYDEYARVGLRVPYSRPSQALWFIHPKHGVTCQWPVYLEPEATSSQSSEWVSFERRDV